MSATLAFRLLSSVAGLLFASAALAAPPVSVAVVHAVEWSPGDTAREGAGEFALLLRVAQLQRFAGATGLVAVGDHNGVLRAGGERALRRLALTGIVVAKIARGGEVAWTPDNLFVDAGDLGEDRVHRVLTRGLELYGAAPVAADPEHPTAREVAAVRAHLKKFQALLGLETGAQVALR